MIGLIFDCDGTLVDTEHLKYLSLHHALQKHGIDYDLQEYIMVVGKSFSVIRQTIEKEKGITLPESLLQEKEEIYQELRENGIPLLETTVAFARICIENKKKLGIKVALASSDIRKNVQANIALLQLHFDAVVSADDLSAYDDPQGVLKPKPYIYLEAARQLGIPPSSCISFEDTCAGVDAAVSAGCLSIALPNDFTKYQDLSQADMVIETLEGMTPQMLLEEVRSLL